MIRQAFNVLYRRILYKIPFKFLLILLALFAVCFASFIKADLQVIDTYTMTLNQNTNYKYYNTSWDFVCVVVNSASNYSNQVAEFTVASTPGWNMMIKFNWNTSNTPNMDKWMWYCGTELIDIVCDVSSCNLTFKTYKSVEYTSLQCQTNYSLIPVSSVDSNYCTNNNLCPVCPVWSGGVSSLYINDILHIGSPFIYMTIPQELSWDYEYTQWWTNMNIDIEWYNVDYEYMDWVVDIQNYKPNSEDLTSLVSSVLPLFVPWLVIILFLYFIFRFIKKVF